MTAIITALNAGRQRALVQRPRRKIHLASIAPGDTHWLTFCDLDVKALGATFWVDDAETLADERPDQICAHCYRLILLSALITAEHLETTQRARAAR